MQTEIMNLILIISSSKVFVVQTIVVADNLPTFHAMPKKTMETQNHMRQIRNDFIRTFFVRNKFSTLSFFSH